MVSGGPIEVQQNLFDEFGHLMPQADIFAICRRKSYDCKWGGNNGLRFSYFVGVASKPFNTGSRNLIQRVFFLSLLNSDHRCVDHIHELLGLQAAVVCTTSGTITAIGAPAAAAIATYAAVNQPQNNVLVSSSSNSSSIIISPAVMSIAAMQPQLPNPANYAAIVADIRAGYKTLVLMRGVPGSGKSHLAHQLYAETVGASPKRMHVMSADDYFTQPDGRYAFDEQSLHMAHHSCQLRIREQAQLGWSPLIVDNTNTQDWEMFPYVACAAEHGYLVHLLEAQTPWCRDAHMLAVRNVHNVPLPSIVNMLKRFMSCDVPTLQRQCKPPPGRRLPVPQMRQWPEFGVMQQLSPPPPVADEPVNPLASVVSLPPWVPPPPEPASPPWVQVMKAPIICRTTEPIDSASPMRSAVLNSNDMRQTEHTISTQMLHLLRDDDAAAAADANITDNASNSVTATTTTTVTAPHRSGCRNENASFATMRTINPSLAPSALWDLFQRCNFDANWAMELLYTNDAPTVHLGGHELRCDCDGQQQTNASPAVSLRRNSNCSTASSGSTSSSECLGACGGTSSRSHSCSSETDLVDMPLDVAMIEQLQRLFGANGFGTTAPQRVQMPRSMARSLHALWLESAHNERVRQAAVADDAAYAQRLQSTEYAGQQQPQHQSRQRKQGVPTAVCRPVQTVSPVSRSGYASSDEQQRDEPQRVSPDKVETLIAAFPQIASSTLATVLEVCYNNLAQARNVLHGCQPHANNTRLSRLENELLDADMRRYKEIGLSDVANELRAMETMTYHDIDLKAALEKRTYEQYRALSRHHRQQQYECFGRAKGAMKRNDADEAVFFARIANFHGERTERCNHYAANCIEELHRNEVQDPMKLDLHYLYVREAAESLDLFLDRHISDIRDSRKAYVELGIITGRGLHSRDNYSKIKEMTGRRLQQRGLVPTELNAGLLGVKITPRSLLALEVTNGGGAVH